MIHVPLDAEVLCSDGPCGKSTHAIANPVTRQLTFLVVQSNQKGSVERLVPVGQVAETNPQMIRLKCTRSEFETFEPFLATRFVEVEVPEFALYDTYDYAMPYAVATHTEKIEVDEKRISSDERALHRGSRVEARDGQQVGEVDELLLSEQTGEITHFTLKTGHLWGRREITLPVSAVDRVMNEVVYLKLNTAAIAELPAIPARRSVQWPSGQRELVVLLYEDMEKANRALDYLKDLKRGGDIGIMNSAVLIKDADGKVEIKEAKDVDKREGRLFGAITGGLVGLVGGPVGVVIGAAAGAVTGGAAAKRIDMGFSNKYLAGLERHLQPGNSALIAVVQHEWVRKVTDELQFQFGGLLFHQALSDEVVANLLEGDAPSSATG